MSSSEYVNKGFKNLVLTCVLNSAMSNWERKYNDYNELNFGLSLKELSLSFKFDYEAKRPITITLKDAEYDTIASVTSLFDSKSIMDSIDFILSNS